MSWKNGHNFLFLMKRLYSTFLLLAVSNVNSYETHTHLEISQLAINNSILATDENFYKSIGFGISAETNIFPGTVPENSDGSYPDDSVYIEETSIIRILSGGAVLEDEGARSVHHFYDPQNGGVGGNLGLPSPDWILESHILPVSGEAIQVSFGNQNFSYKDANEYYYHALTLPDEESRLVNFGLMFRSLGHVIHHLQDMAQPQHVRNDPHCNATNDFPSFAFLCLLAGKHNPSYYENFTNTWITDNPVSSAMPKLPRAASARDFWDNASGSGISQYTSLNFVSDGTNYTGDANGTFIPAPLFPAPAPLQKLIPIALPELLDEDPSLSEVDKESILQRLGCTTDPDKSCIVDFIQNRITIDGESIVNTRSSSISIFDEEIRVRNIEISLDKLVPYKTSRLLSLNRFNFVQAYPFLLPRAVAYSAGLIDHFFRGRLEVEQNGWSDTSALILSVKNISMQNSTLEAGTFEIYYDSVDGVRKQLSHVEIIEGSLPLPSDGSVSLLSNFPEDLNEAAENPFVLVFNALDGHIGGEKGIATARFPPPITGKVEKLSRLGGACAGKVYAVWIYFDEQPQNSGHVNLVGQTSNTTLDFSLFPEGVETVSGGSLWFHGWDPASGKYLYLISNRLPFVDYDPCTSPDLDAWMSGESVKGTSSGFRY